jgi:hypothetical protein
MTRFGMMAVGVLMVAATACGGEGVPSGVASLDDPLGAADSAVSDAIQEVDQEEAILAFTECLREQGLDVEDPTFDGDGGLAFNFGELPSGGGDERSPGDEFRAAFDECSPLMEGVAGRFDPADRSEIEDSLLAFAQCLRAEGLDVPDPDFSGLGDSAGGPRPFGGAIEMDDPATRAAFEQCQSELAFGGPGGGPGRIGGGNNGGTG